MVGSKSGENLSAPAAACDAVNARPPATIVPVRTEPRLASALKLTVPSPDPLAPAVTCSHASFDTAVQVQPSGVLTSKIPEPPVPCNDTNAGLRTYKQGAPA